MSTFELAPRQVANARKLRKLGMIPVGLVAKTHETLPYQISINQFRDVMHGGGHSHVDVQVQGEKGTRKAIVKQIDRDPLHHAILNITLQEVSAEDRVRMDVPIVGVGLEENEDAKAGGVTLTLVTDHLKLRGRVDEMPESITVDVSKLAAGASITAGELELPGDIELQNTPDTIIFSNTINRVYEEEVEPTETETEAGEEGAEAEPSEG
jgi:large subunit ribosomal protein L25